MTVTPKALIPAKYASASGAQEYKAPPTGVCTIIDKFTCWNSSGAGETLTVYLLPAGGTHDASNQIAAKAISAGALADFSELQNQILNAGESIYVTASTGSKLSIRASGREVS